MFNEFIDQFYSVSRYIVKQPRDLINTKVFCIGEEKSGVIDIKTYLYSHIKFWLIQKHVHPWLLLLLNGEVRGLIKIRIVMKISSFLKESWIYLDLRDLACPLNPHHDSKLLYNTSGNKSWLKCIMWFEVKDVTYHNLGKN